MTKIYGALGILVIVIIAGIALMVWPAPTQAPTNGGSQTPATTTPQQTAGIPDLITVDSPRIGGTVSSPLTITGSARGMWYFEASFPVELLDDSGRVIAQHHAEAQGEWMTTDFVPFTATLSFPQQPEGSIGTLILRKDNPSGLPENDRSIEIPVRF